MSWVVSSTFTVHLFGLSLPFHCRKHSFGPRFQMLYLVFASWSTHKSIISVVLVHMHQVQTFTSIRLLRHKTLVMAVYSVITSRVVSTIRLNTISSPLLITVIYQHCRRVSGGYARSMTYRTIMCRDTRRHWLNIILILSRWLPSLNEKYALHVWTVWGYLLRRKEYVSGEDGLLYGVYCSS